MLRIHEVFRFISHKGGFNEVILSHPPWQTCVNWRRTQAWVLETLPIFFPKIVFILQQHIFLESISFLPHHNEPKWVCTKKNKKKTWKRRKSLSRRSRLSALAIEMRCFVFGVRLVAAMKSSQFCLVTSSHPAAKLFFNRRIPVAGENWLSRRIQLALGQV